jgi:hypothetical protein
MTHYGTFQRLTLILTVSDMIPAPVKEAPGEQLGDEHMTIVEIISYFFFSFILMLGSSEIQQKG